MKKLIATLLISLSLAPAFAGPRESLLFDDGWKFTLGNAADPQKDFGYGTEYFNFWTKAASIHNEGPYSQKFDEDRWGKEWQDVKLPHDWVTELPFDASASHSHGYKTVGPGFPETSVGWYRKVFDMPTGDLGKAVSLRFDGIFHSSQVWVNGFYLGREDDGYVSTEYDISQYLNYGGSNVVAVRVDASQESGWFYEGAGIYRHVWLNKTSTVHFAPDGIFFRCDNDDPRLISLDCKVVNEGLGNCAAPEFRFRLLDAAGKEAANGAKVLCGELMPRDAAEGNCSFKLSDANLWSVEDPYLYTLEAGLYENGICLDEIRLKVGVRSVVFDADKGFLLNGERVQLKGVNLHQDHAGVGSAIPDGLYEYRLARLREFGCNAIRSSHNPMAPALLDLCDSLGFLVIDENRLMGVNDYHREHLERMIRRDRNHPCVIIWSIGNEEWGIEWNDFGRRLTRNMREICHRCDPGRRMTVATSSGPVILEGSDVAGFNYILQNDVDDLHEKYPERPAIGTEETTGCGTRGCYFADATGASMPAINRGKQGPDSLYNCIERGWQFYHSRPHLAGLFYWTGFDYRGESNPLVYPATGSGFGLLDYCGFFKDEAWYLKAWWTDETVLHLLPHWNLAGHEGEKISVWAYSNCDEVELFANGKKLGRKKMPLDGHLEWTAVYKPGSLKAVGYKKGRKVITEIVRTAGAASQIECKTFVSKGIAVVDMRLLDRQGNFVPDACNTMEIEIDGEAKLLGVGNGDQAWKADEKSPRWKAFNGCAQCIIELEGKAVIRIKAEGCEAVEIKI